jgi:hypothetical protein
MKERAAKRHEERQAKREEFRKQCDADPKACAEKKAQFKQKMQERRAAMPERRGNAPGAPAPAAK